MENKTKITFLGGLESIGKNIMVLEYIPEIQKEKFVILTIVGIIVFHFLFFAPLISKVISDLPQGESGSADVEPVTGSSIWVRYNLMLFFTPLGLYLCVKRKDVVALGLILFGLTFATTHQRLDINTGIRQYQSYYWILGLKFQNEKFDYPGISSLVCSQGNYSQAYGKYQRIHISGIMYRGYIIIPEKEPLFIGQHKNKSNLMRKLEKIAQQLNVYVEDQTQD